MNYHHSFHDAKWIFHWIIWTNFNFPEKKNKALKITAARWFAGEWNINHNHGKSLPQNEMQRSTNLFISRGEKLNSSNKDFNLFTWKIHLDTCGLQDTASCWFFYVGNSKYCFASCNSDSQLPLQIQNMNYWQVYWHSSVFRRSGKCHQYTRCNSSLDIESHLEWFRPLTWRFRRI